MAKRALHPYSRIAAVCTVASLSVATAPAWASGFRLPEASIAGLATSNALVANEKLLGAIPYNPAAMAFHDGTHVIAGAMLVQPDLSVTPEEGGPNVTSVGKDNIFVPNAALTARLDEQWSWGLLINAPFGLETTWPEGTFPKFAGPLEPAHPTHSNIEMLNFNPNAAYRVNENTSLAFGLDFYHVMSVALDAAGANVGGTGSGIGVNLATMHTAGPWSFGGSYRSAVDADIDGAVGPAPATTEVNFPWMLQVGAKYQPSDKWAVELDIERTGWSRFDVIEIDSPFPAAQATSTNNWDDANAYRIGGIYQLSDKTQLRLGYTFDETGQPEEHFSARVPDADRQLLSVGFAHEFGGWTLEGGYMYVKFDDRTVDNTAPPAADPNGTSAYNGEYESNVNLFGLGVTKKF